MQRVQQLFDELTDGEKLEFINTNKSCLESKRGSSKILDMLKTLISYELEAMNEWMCSIIKGQHEYYYFDHIPFYELINGECINNEGVIQTLIDFYDELTSDFYQVDCDLRENDQVHEFKDLFKKIVRNPYINEDNRKLVVNLIEEMFDETSSESSGESSD